METIETNSTALIYRSLVDVESQPGAIKLVRLPIEPQAVPMGLHGPIAEHYGVAPGSFTPHASTLDYIVGAVTACLTGTLTRALASKRIPTAAGRLHVEGIGEIESEEGVLVIRRIEVVVHLSAESERRKDAADIVANYAMQCPVYRTLYRSISITTTLKFVDLP